jgi:Ca2+-transporting ATPase
MYTCTCTCTCTYNLAHTRQQELRPELLRDLSLNAALNSKAFLVEHGDLLEFVGNRTECALLVLGRKWGVNYQQVRISCV